MTSKTGDNANEDKQKAKRLFLCYLRDRVCSSFSGAGKFCLGHGVRQLTRDVRGDVRTLNFRSDVTFAPPRKTRNGRRTVGKRSLCDVKCQK